MKYTKAVKGPNENISRYKNRITKNIPNWNWKDHDVKGELQRHDIRNEIEN